MEIEMSQTITEFVESRGYRAERIFNTTAAAEGQPIELVGYETQRTAREQDNDLLGRQRALSRQALVRWRRLRDQPHQATLICPMLNAFQIKLAHSMRNDMDLFNNLNRDEAKAELARQVKAHARLVERRDLAIENMKLRERDMKALRARMKVAPAATKFLY